jgi:predicted CxxxxCH...CXXCH cytochrome family protein
VAQVPGTAFGTCDNVYCHSNGQNNGGTGITYRQPTWGTASTGSCGKCHDVYATHNFAGPEISTGSHTKHLLYNSMTNSDPVKCTQCHNWSGEPFNPVCYSQCHTGNAIPTRHANHQIEIMIPTYFGYSARYNGSPNPGSGYSSCSNVYCHSNGTSVATGSVPANISPVWGSGTPPCTGCHGFPPSYANGSPKANSHLKHAAAGFGCNACHGTTSSNGTTITNYSRHVNRSYDLAPAAGISFTYVFAPTGGTCSNISCHNNGSAVWGTTLRCGDCHTVSPGGD